MINPLFVYLFAWVGVLFLYSLNLTENLVPISPVGLLMIVANIFGMAVIYILLCFRVKPASSSNHDDFLMNRCIKKFIIILFWIWFLGSLLEILFSKGFPLLWVLMGMDKLYVDFGIPSFHGIMNALYLQLMTIMFYVYIKYKEKKYLLVILLMFSWPVLMLGRGILLSAILQMGCVYIYFNRVGFLKIIKMLALLIVVICCFGFLGDLRQTANPFAYIVRDEYMAFFENIPTGFLWFYVYLTAGLSNFFFNIDLNLFNLNFGYSFSNMLPSLVRGYFDLDARNDLFNFVDPNLNTSTIYAGFVSDFGMLGGVFLVGLIQVFICYTYRILKKGHPWGIMAYAVSLQICAFSIFYDMFFLLPTLFQFLVTFMFWRYYVYFKNKNRLC